MEDFIGIVRSAELDFPLVITVSQVKDSYEASDRLSEYCIEQKIFPEETIVLPVDGLPNI